MKNYSKKQRAENITAVIEGTVIALLVFVIDVERTIQIMAVGAMVFMIVNLFVGLVLDKLYK